MWSTAWSTTTTNRPDLALQRAFARKEQRIRSPLLYPAELQGPGAQLSPGPCRAVVLLAGSGAGDGLLRARGLAAGGDRGGLGGADLQDLDRADGAGLGDGHGDLGVLLQRLLEEALEVDGAEGVLLDEAVALEA